jgi:hypothetical protein
MAVPMERGLDVHGMSPRLINAVVGVWLFLSAFLWPHTRAQMFNTWISGVLCVVFAVAGIAAPGARHLNTALAIWIFVSSWTIPSSSAATLWNNVLCAIAIFVVSLIPSDTKTLPHSMVPPKHAT